MPDKPHEPIEEMLARLYAFVHVIPEFVPEPVSDELDPIQVTEEAVLAMADAQAFLERVMRRAKP